MFGHQIGDHRPVEPHDGKVGDREAGYRMAGILKEGVLPERSAARDGIDGDAVDAQFDRAAPDDREMPDRLAGLEHHAARRASLTVSARSARSGDLFQRQRLEQREPI